MIFFMINRLKDNPPYKTIMPKKTTTTKKTTTKKTASKKAVVPPPAPVEEPVEETTVEEPVVEETTVDESAAAPAEEEAHNDTLTEQFDVMLHSLKMAIDQFRDLTKVVKHMRAAVSKLEKAEHKREEKRAKKGTRKNDSNSGFQKTHNIAGTALAEFLETEEASMVDAHKAICAYIKGREDVPKFPGDGRIIIMDDTLDKIFPGLMENYPAALKVAGEAQKIEDNKERRAYLDEHIDGDSVLTYSGIMKRLPTYFKKEETSA